MVYPFASCIDTPLPAVPEKDQIHLMVDYKLPHVDIPSGVPKQSRFPEYPNIGIKEWHEKHGLYEK